MVSITCKQPQKEYMIELVIAIVMFILEIFQGIALLNAQKFLVSLTHGIPFCAFYSLIMFGIIHLV
jgi:hypothetical protein